MSDRPSDDTDGESWDAPFDPLPDDDSDLRAALDSLIHPEAAGPPTPREDTPAIRLPDAAPALLDAATGLLGPAAWWWLLGWEDRRHAQEGRPCLLVQLEPAGIEPLARRLGAEAADRLVQVAAAMVREETRRADLFARLPAWRIVGLLPEADGEPARSAVEQRLRASYAWRLGPSIPIRLAVGSALPDRTTSLADALELAERALHLDARRPVTGGDRGSPAGPPEEGSPAVRPEGGSPAVRAALLELERLLTEGIIDRQEYRARRAAILDRL